MAKASVQPGNVSDVAIIGAGPYGLSLAAHLGAMGVSFRIFGHPMSVWATQMPKGMKLKSEGFASSLSAPNGEFTLGDYCRKHGLKYADIGSPVPVQTFIDYGIAFQKRFAPDLEEQFVVALREVPAGFELELEDGEKVLARKIAVAAGITHYGYVPPELASLPGELVSHSSEHHELSGLQGRHVAVIGAGASALDLAGLLHEAGANVEVFARASVIRFHDPPRKRSLYQRMSNPMTGIGAGKQLYFYANMPHIFRYLPLETRLDRVKKTLGPAPGWFVRDQVVGKVPMHLNAHIAGAEPRNGGVALDVAFAGGQRRTVEFDHVVAATGYQVDLKRLQFLNDQTRASIRTEGNAPALSANFESSVRGLYFVGPAAANSFGPLMRFAFGVHFTTPRVARHLARPMRGKSPVHEGAEQTQAVEPR